MSNNNSYTKGILNSELFGATSKPLSSYFESTRHFVTKDYIKDGFTFLDVGGGGGAFAYAIANEVNRIKVTIIDPDKKAIDEGKKKYKEFEFINDFFPSNRLGNRKFDYVSIQALFPQMPKWKEMVKSLVCHSKQYINISLTVKLHGEPVIDNDISYVYYLDSGERVHQITHNLRHFMNFLCIHELRLKNISFYGYHTSVSGDNYRDVANDEQIKGNVLLEKFSENDSYPIRMGGSCQSRNNPAYCPWKPNLDILIDNNKYEL